MGNNNHSPIRKISVGADYKSAMHYIVGQTVMGGRATIHAIMQGKDADYIEVWVENEAQEVYRWKRFNQSMPLSIEDNIDF